MNRAALRALNRALRRRFYHGRHELPRISRHERRQAMIREAEVWIGELLEPTPPPPPAEMPPWPPRTAWWVLPDDTLILPRVRTPLELGPGS